MASSILQDIKNSKPNTKSLDIQTIANWSYLHMALSVIDLTESDLLYLIGLELKHKKRLHIIKRLYSRYLSTKRKNDLKILEKEI